MYDLTPSSHDYDHQASSSGFESNEDGPLGSTAHATIVRSKAQCRRQFESGLERYMNLVKSRGWAMYSADLLFAVRIEVTDSVTKKTSIGMYVFVLLWFLVSGFVVSPSQASKSRRRPPFVMFFLLGQATSICRSQLVFATHETTVSWAVGKFQSGQRLTLRRRARFWAADWPLNFVDYCVGVHLPSSFGFHSLTRSLAQACKSHCSAFHAGASCFLTLPPWYTRGSKLLLAPPN